jgi:hypothetical protein
MGGEQEPRVSTLIAVSQALQVPFEDLLTGVVTRVCHQETN